jgi:hypothetical protein
LNDHAVDILSTEGVKITKQSLGGKFNKHTVEFLKKVLNTINTNLKCVDSAKLLNVFSSVYIQDGTYFKLPCAYSGHYGGMGNKKGLAGAKIMFTYDYKNGNFTEAELVEGKRSDAQSGQNCDWIEPNSLILRDLGFFSIGSLKEVEEKRAFYVSKLQPRTGMYIKKEEGYVKLDIKSLVNKMKTNRINSISLKIHIGSKKEIETTAFVQLLPEEIVEERIRTKKKTGEGRNWNMSDEFVYWAHVNVFVTNIKPDTYRAKDIVRIYRLRWQVEIIFKTWKSHHRIHEYKALKVERFQSYVYASLIGLLLESKIYHYFNMHCLERHQRLVSFIKFSKAIVQQRHELKKLFGQAEEAIQKTICILNELKKELYLEIKKGKENQYNILNISKI